MSGSARSGGFDGLKITVLGAGAWGTALAIALGQRHAVSLWGRDRAQTHAIAASRRNPYLPGAELPAAVSVDSDLQRCLDGAELAIVATPVAALREMLGALAAAPRRTPLLWACKGLERGTARMPHEIAAEQLPGQRACGALSGPSFAQEVARGLPTALTLASRDLGFARDTAKALHQSTLRVYYSEDVAGVEVGGAVKNVMAIATGICEGLGLGLNARAALITRGLAEITRLGSALGGRPETFMGLAGAGDLILTCTGDLSRNRRVGLELAQGGTLEEVLARLGHVAEGVDSAREVARVSGRLGIDMPITAAVCAVLFEGVTPKTVVEQLLARDPGTEV
jgi:glycerol-3-phosphate dehydrogenase (NAD(P)+)